MYPMDWGRFHLQRFQNRKINHDFRVDYPDAVLPPDYLMYETFRLDYRRYYSGGRDTANWLVNLVSKHIDLSGKRILDWGCGPGRVVRHLPEILGGKDCRFYGADYNNESIKWCSEHLPGIDFVANSLEAHLPYDDCYLDVIYGISIFTHLSERLHHDWCNELLRVLKPGGILFLTTHGDNFKVKLTANELTCFSNGRLVVRGAVKEGHRTYAAFQPKAFMQELFSNVQILEHIEPELQTGKTIPQDIWIVRKQAYRVLL